LSVSEVLKGKDKARIFLGRGEHEIVFDYSRIRKTKIHSIKKMIVS
jgi:hypothetical protein